VNVPLMMYLEMIWSSQFSSEEGFIICWPDNQWMGETIQKIQTGLSLDC